MARAECRHHDWSPLLDLRVAALMHVCAGVVAVSMSTSPCNSVAAATTSSPGVGAPATARVVQGSPEEGIHHTAEKTSTKVPRK